MEDRYISYLRVSTEEQHKSGLGLDAQRYAIAVWLGDRKLIGEYIDIASGKRDDREQLDLALAACRRKGCCLLVSKQDRLSRDSYVIHKLIKDGVKFIAVDTPTEPDLMKKIRSDIADEEHRLISCRTKEALQQAKLRGVVLGTPANLTPQHRAKGRQVSIESRKRKAKQYADELRPIIEQYQQEGLGLRLIAQRLTEAGELTPRRKSQWGISSVQSLIKTINEV